MSVWDKLPIKSGSGGIWDFLILDQKLPSVGNLQKNIWDQVSINPGGMWSEIGNETLVLARPDIKQSIWQEANDETLILESSCMLNLWSATQEQLDETLILSREHVIVWDELENETLLLPRSQLKVWTIPKIRDTTGYKPLRSIGWALKELQTAKGEPYWVLKCLSLDSYLRLNEKEAFLWNLMDGAHSLQDLAVASFLKYKTLSIDSLMNFLGQLHERGFLISEEVDVYQATSKQLYRSSFNYWRKRCVDLLVNFEISFKGVDKFYGALFRLGGWLLYTPPILVFLWIVTALGIPAFLYLTHQAQLTIFQGASESLGVGLVGLIVAEILERLREPLFGV